MFYFKRFQHSKLPIYLKFQNFLHLIFVAFSLILITNYNCKCVVADILLLIAGFFGMIPHFLILEIQISLIYNFCRAGIESGLLIPVSSEGL